MEFNVKVSFHPYILKPSIEDIYDLSAYIQTILETPEFRKFGILKANISFSFFFVRVDFFFLNWFEQLFICLKCFHRF